MKCRGPHPGLDHGLDKVPEVGHGVANRVIHCNLLYQAKPPHRCFEGGRLREVGNVIQDLVAGLHHVRHEHGKLHLHLTELQLLAIKGYSIVLTPLEVVKGVVEVPFDAVIVEEHIILHIALPLHHLGDLVCPLGVGITRPRLALWGPLVAVSAKKCDELVKWYLECLFGFWVNTKPNWAYSYSQCHMLT